MTALAADRRIPQAVDGAANGTGYILDVQVGALEQIWQGSFVTLDTGDKYAAALTVPDAFFGMALETVLGGSSNGDVTCKCLVNGVISHTIASIAVADIGKPCFATDDQTLTITNDGTDTPIGLVVNVPATGTAIIQMFRPKFERSPFTFINFTADYDIDCNGVVTIIGDGLGTLFRELVNQGILQGTVAA